MNPYVYTFLLGVALPLLFLVAVFRGALDYAESGRSTE